MVEFDVKERNLDDYPYVEIPKNWVDTVLNCLDEINALLDYYNYPRDTVDIMEVKEKYNTLRIFFCIPQLLDDEGLTGLDLLNLKTLENFVAVIVEKYEKLIKMKIANGEL